MRSSKDQLQLVSERLEVDGFCIEAIAATLQNEVLVCRHGLRGDSDYRNMVQLGLLADPRGQGQTIFTVKLNVEQYGVRLLGSEHGERRQVCR